MTRHSRLNRLVPMLAAASVTTAAAVSLALPASAAPVPFTPGDLAVYQVGTASGSLSSAAAPVFIDEYSPSGTLVQSIPLPTTASGPNDPLVASGTATSEGELTLSANGAYLLATGYDAAPSTASIASSTVPRVVARIDNAADIDTSTALTDAYLGGNNIRTATSSDGNTIWVGGANGIGATTLGTSTSTQLSTQNTRQLAIFNGQLDFSSSSGSDKGVGTVGSGEPITGNPQTLTLLASSASAYSYDLVSLGGGSTPDTLYIADSTTSGTSPNLTASIFKFGLSGSSWVAEGSISVPVGLSTNNLEGLAVSVSSGTATLFATAGGNGATGFGALYKATDSTGAGGTATGAATSIATVGVNESFRGVSFVPTGSGTGTGAPEVPVALALPLAAVALLGGTSLYAARRRRGATQGGTTPVSA